MKQAANQLFRRCPYQNAGLACPECPNYQRCADKKKKRLFEHIINNVLDILLIIAMIVSIVFLIIFVNELKPIKVTQYTVSTTTEQCTEIVDLAAGLTTTLSTEQEAIIEVENPAMEEPTVEKIPIEEILEESFSADETDEKYLYDLSEEEKILLAKLVWAESRGEPFEGKVAVAAVVLNRYYYGEDCDFDRESIEAVITQKNQFANIENVTMDDLQEVPECMEAVEAACKGSDPTREVFPEGALYFFAHDKVSGYQKEIRQGLEVMVIGNHSFHINFEKVR